MIASERSRGAKWMNSLLRWLALSLLFVGTHALAQSTGTVTYVYTDPQGTPLAEADANGNITATFEYTPYGTFAPKGTTNPGQDPNGPGYTGHVNDPETNLVYMQARYYDPVTGRFISVDLVPINPGSPSGFDRYSYASNNPTANIDPTGQSPGDPNDLSDAYPTQVTYFGNNGTSSPRAGTNQSSGHPPHKYSVDEVFVNYQATLLGGRVTQIPIPADLRAALQKILDSPVGQAIATQALNQGEKIALALEPSNVRLMYQWSGHDDAIIYTMNLDGFKAASDPWGELKGAGLDVVIVHEMGHTPYAARALGYSQESGYWQNEFSAVRHVENPYRAFIGLPLRTTYGGVPIPPPLKQ